MPDSPIAAYERELHDAVRALLVLSNAIINVTGGEQPVITFDGTLHIQERPRVRFALVNISAEA